MTVFSPVEKQEGSLARWHVMCCHACPRLDISSQVVVLNPLPINQNLAFTGATIYHGPNQE